MFQKKKGKCVDCPPDASLKYLTAKRCGFHYPLHRKKVNAGKAHNVEKEQTKKDLNVYFASQILQITDCCENCGTDIRWMRQNKNFARSLVAHILPKRKMGGFPTVATHPKNRFFACPDCHGGYDNQGSDFAKKMPALPLLIERFNEFKHLLTRSEYERVPDFLKPEND